jgi:hypothetical protein
MKKFFLLLLLFPALLFAQIEKTKEYTHKTNPKIKVTIVEMYENQMQHNNDAAKDPVEKFKEILISRKITVKSTDPAVPEPDIDLNQLSQLNLDCETVVVTTPIINLDGSSASPQPVSQKIFLFDRLNLVKWEMKDNKYQVTYFDNPRSGTSTLKSYTSPITSDGYLATKNGGSKLSFPFGLLCKDKAVYPILSITTIPFKVRPSVDDRGQFVEGGLTNIGIHYPIISYNKTKLFFDGKYSNHSWSFGVIGAPMALKTNAENTNGRKPIERTSLALSCSTAISYSYNDITFTFIPAGVDYGLNTTSRYWNYHGKFWWGFGIGISPKLLSRISE